MRTDHDQIEAALAREVHDHFVRRSDAYLHARLARGQVAADFAHAHLGIFAC